MEPSTATDSTARRWLIGVGRADVTDRRPGLGMAGFAYPRQRTSGELLDDPDGNPIPLYARAFYLRGAASSVEGVATAHPGTHVLIVVVDIWTCTMAVKAEVLDRLNSAHSGLGSKHAFTDANVLIAGTHTHAAPGGYSDYALYNYSMGGWNQRTFDVIVHGIVKAALAAIGSAVPGRVLLNRGDLYGCGGNRAMAALRRNPEFCVQAHPRTWTDTDMVVVRFVADAGRDLGMLSLFALHPTSLGMFNRVISGDNKGWAAMLVERQMRQTSPGFVAAFGNANAGDVSGNVQVGESGEVVVHRPFGGERQAGVLAVPRSAPKGDVEADLAIMRRLGRQQADFALDLFRAATRELSAVAEGRAVFVDMANVQMGEAGPEHTDGGGRPERTAAAAFGISFGAGSTEDGIGFASIGSLDVDIRIPEGMNCRRSRRGRLGLIAAGLTAIAGAAAAAIRGRRGLAPLMALVPVVAAAAVPECRGAAAAAVARRTLTSELPVPTGAGADGGSWVVPPARHWSSDFVQNQAPKPVMFAAGLARWRSADSAGLGEQPCPLAPNVVPVQVLALGELGLVAVPAEFTSTAGRRLKQALREALGEQFTDVALAGYANGYSGYVTTAQEYAAQLYEGASTLYGPHTLAAYQQVVRHLAHALVTGGQGPTGPPYVERFVVPVVAAGPV